ncbi:MAG: FkbM family methyltransferase [Fulvivirga sp.]|uniref:FkbM family methyltransferase n=1 Tax=Fulvivirga sp. TaxID=1931237 RepID=UPI0032EB448A
MIKLIHWISNKVISFLNSSLTLFKHPINLDDLRFSTLSFSQFGEDIFIFKVLEKSNDKGIYIDIGAFHPKLFSLTYLLYLNGWRGISIDANPNNIDNHKKYRPADQAILAAVGKQKGKALFAEYSDPATNRLIFSTEEDQKSVTGLTAEKISEVAVVPPMDLLQGIPEKVDLLSIDCEGLDFSILKEIDIEKVDPYLIAIESHDEIESREVEDYLHGFNYKLVGRFFFTYIYQRDRIK